MARGDVPGNVALLLNVGADPKARGKYGRTPSHFASAFGTPETIATLLEAGALVTFSDGQGWQALHWAAKYGSPENIAALLDADANPAIEDEEGKSPGDLAKAREELQATDAYRGIEPRQTHPADGSLASLAPRLVDKLGAGSAKILLFV